MELPHRTQWLGAGELAEDRIQTDRRFSIGYPKSDSLVCREAFSSNKRVETIMTWHNEGRLRSSRTVEIIGAAKIDPERI